MRQQCAVEDVNIQAAVRLCIAICSGFEKDQGEKRRSCGGFIPNIPESVIAMLAATSMGAIWSSCSPDFGIQGVMDRFGQIEPVVLFTTTAFFYKGKRVDLMPKIKEITKKSKASRKLSLSHIRKELISN